ncbi:DNA-remodelling protein DnaD [Streptococcus infantarius subsp. infantarius]|uniref:DnaD domain-containing protein n=1 Tax=Streptococcus TaxID=1301 RepID=UPI000EC95EA4|nr:MULTISPECIES: DnaD domain-containing protein [Streptococcus]MBT0896968.1 DnaD domain-containing protein [Streptococcus infantarius subsp. infantarius]MBT0900151.1 DnaD domain-containing protein [Streptococcus infantarius subsp. infantarius]MBT0904101.1 DnaD domain-containing protein [Streptococcus infantarius subsp. infantarius]MBT0918014.1 DnaD domain-containing protein [Streptococcus infantarius subsp. infantarius]MBT0931791.1 DnaD domain-containing protein [Streptococcus infantarius subs
MNYLENYKSGNLVLPSALLFHYKDIFKRADDFLIWQFIYLQNTTKMDDLAPSQIASALNKTVAEVNRSISDLTAQGLLDMKTIELGSEIEVIFDASPVLALLDKLVSEPKQVPEKQDVNPVKELVEDFERELGRMLSPFELEDLQKTIREDKTDPDLVRAALREAVFNGKTNWNYINAILRNWRREGITTMRQVEERRKEHEDSKTGKVNVSDDFLAAMDLWSD